MKAQIENLWKIYENTSELIRSADTKATALLAVNGVVVGFYVSSISLLRDILAKSPLAFLLLVPALIFLIFSMYFSVNCVFPRLKTNGGLNLTNVIFFQEVTKSFHNAEGYKKAIEQAFKDDKILQANLSEEIWIISSIANNKYQSVRRAVYSFLFALFAGIAFASVAIVMLTL